MDTLYDSYERKGYLVEIHRDENPMNPREEFDNFGHMICFHPNYNLGDKYGYSDVMDFVKDMAIDYFNPDTVETDYWAMKHSEFIDKYLDKLNQHIVILPLFLYEHSGITMNTTGFSCPWDSGQVGFIYATRDEVLQEYSKKKLTKKLREKVVEILRGEVTIYDDYLTGNVYGYIIKGGIQCHCGATEFEDAEDGETIRCKACGYEASEKDFHREELDSCWGFYGDPNAEYGIIAEANAIIDHREYNPE